MSGATSASSLAALALGAVIAFAAAPRQAVADATSADKAFRKGKKLQQQKNYAEACPAFEESFKEDPAIGAMLNVARCYEEWGKLVTALESYQEAYKLAKGTKDDRAPQIKELVEELEKKVPQLIVALPKGRLAPPGLVVTLDGARLSLEQLGEPVRVEVGEHTIVTRSDETEEHTVELKVAAGKKVPVELVLEAKQDPEESPVVISRDEQPERTASKASKRKTIALVVGGVGVVGLGVATFVALDARSDYNDAFDGNCDPDSLQCTPDARKTTNDARSRANLATVIGGVGLAAVVTGAVLYFSAPNGKREKKEREREKDGEARYLRPVLMRDGAGVAFGGTM
jgi:tetratricopeptide (TPR) repeat protein